MPARRLKAAPDPGIAAALTSLRRQLEVEIEFPSQVLEEADRSAADPRLPNYDQTDLPLVTIDPPESMDLDQALFIERRSRGYLVRYAIADVAAFVAPGGAIDRESHRRGQTLYAPDGDARLHPPAISERAGSLLPNQVRPALLWNMYLEADGEGTKVEIRRALVKSRAKLSYESAQAQIDTGSGNESLMLLKEVGLLRQERETRLGGINLPIPEQRVIRDNGEFRLELRAPLPVEGWNAQISLMAGQAAAEVMLEAEVGVLRTLPRAGPAKIERFRLTAQALGVEWDPGTSFAELIRQLDASIPAQAALINEAASLMRGSGYAVFDDEVPTDAGHAGVGAEYAHTTAPLRRLVDRYVGEVCVSVSSENPVPDWVHEALPELPELMERSTRRAQQYEAGIVSIFEAAVLAPDVGQSFEAVVVDLDDTGGTIQLLTPPVTAHCLGKDLPLGRVVTVVCEKADIQSRQVAFRYHGTTDPQTNVQGP